MIGRVGGEGAHGYLACHFTCGMTAHPVGNRIEGRRHDKAVFVMLSHAADVGTAAELHGGAPALGARTRRHYANLTRMATSPIVTTSLLRSAVGSKMRCPFTVVPLVLPKSSTNRFCPIRVKRAWRPET